MSQDGTMRNKHATNLRRTRTNMLGTDDQQHYWQCHDAAKEIERLEKLLNGRDDFIVAHGLWEEFVATLPAALRKQGEPS